MQNLCIKLRKLPISFAVFFREKITSLKNDDDDIFEIFHIIYNIFASVNFHDQFILCNKKKEFKLRVI